MIYNVGSQFTQISESGFHEGKASLVRLRGRRALTFIRWAAARMILPYSSTPRSFIENLLAQPLF